MDSIIFIDTNIMLDFYRLRAAGTSLSVLEHIDRNLPKIITGNQVEMEFKKNRQRVFLEALNRIKAPDWSGLGPPAFLSEARQALEIEKSKSELVAQQKALKSRIESVLKNPTKNDPVFQTMQRLFRHKGPFNLDRLKKERYQIRRLAWRRFILGYPPRKAGDTSMGDAVNWEWIVHCAQTSGSNVVIVSRDSDFGIPLGNDYLLNDALSQEFKERVSRKRRITLTDKITTAFKVASIPVTKKEVQQENVLIKEIQAQPSVPVSPTQPSLGAVFAEFFRAMAEAQAKQAALQKQTPNK